MEYQLQEAPLFFADSSYDCSQLRRRKLFDLLGLARAAMAEESCMLVT